MTCPLRSGSTALALADAYARGDADPLDVVEVALAYASEARATFIATLDARALEEAAASAARWRAGKPLGPLDGVPVAWKDLFDVAGAVTTAGAAIYRSRASAASDAALVTAARRAGLIAIGKTNLSEFAYSGLGLNPHFGTPTYPHGDMTEGARAPGGSSSGAAIALAENIVPLSVGTDTAGSIRIPAAFNGLVGYRASTARYPRGGMTALAPTLDTGGPLARTVADCMAFDAVVRGASFIAPCASLRTQRFVIDPGWLSGYTLEPAVARDFEQFVARLRETGARVEAHAFASLSKVRDLGARYGWLGAIEAFETHRALLESSEAEGLDPRVRGRLEASRDLSDGRLDTLHAARAGLLTLFRDELGDATFVAPTVAHVAPPLDPLEADPERFSRINLATLALTMPGSFLDTPAIALPAGADDGGWPTSVQLMRARGDDDALLAVALAIEKHED